MAMPICVNTACAKGLLKIQGASSIKAPKKSIQRQAERPTSGSALRGWGELMRQPSRVPIKPRGRTINISTKIK